MLYIAKCIFANYRNIEQNVIGIIRTHWLVYFNKISNIVDCVVRVLDSVPVGMKNPTSGDITVMMNSIKAAQSSHMFAYRGWEVETRGNAYSHAILRGYVDKQGKSHPNYHFEDLYNLYETYKSSGLKNPAVIIDTNHANSGKKYLEQIRISKEIIHSARYSPEVKSIVKGLMIESYIEDGCQTISDHEVYGKSITDPCLGWEKTERLIYDLADLL